MDTKSHSTTAPAVSTGSDLSQSQSAQFCADQEKPHQFSLESTIYRYKAEWFLHLAKSCEVVELGGSDTNIAYDRRHSIALENWSRPAIDMSESIMALEFALADYETGDTPRIPAMIKAALGWMQAECASRRAA